jgi:hypothetical protein
VKLIFQDESFSYELLRTLGYASYCGADVGECIETASRATEGDFRSWYAAWTTTANRVRAIGDRALQEGRLVSATTP